MRRSLRWRRNLACLGLSCVIARHALTWNFAFLGAVSRGRADVLVSRRRSPSRSPEPDISRLTAPGQDVGAPHLCGSSGSLSLSMRQRLCASDDILPTHALGKEPTKPEEDDSPNVALIVSLVLLAAGPAMAAATWTTWWVASGAISLAALLYFVVAAPVLIALTVAGSLAIMTLTGMQLVGFSMLATGLALFGLFLKGSIALAGAAAVYALVTGKLPSLPTLRAADAVPATTPEMAPSESVGPDSALSEWDRRFKSRASDAPAPRELIRFEDLSPTSPLAELTAFIAQEELAVRTSGRTKAELYKEIAVMLLRR
mmetsp:Transcript_18888/g.39288  ORF Transcript_18888/g.39288 Transcript_18888/m.39288 type:complete len:315 (-) Transcript_18888:5-949(-)